MPGADRLSKYCTVIGGEGVFTFVQYHRTRIVEWTSEWIVLRTGGWKGVTTKRKMNQTARQFGLGFGVHQRKHIWYVSRWDETNRKWIDEREFEGDEFHIHRGNQYP